MMIKFLKIGIGLVLLALLLMLLYAKVTNKNFNEMALGILSTIKEWRGESVPLEDLNKVERTLMNHDIWDQLLKQYVDEEGNVTYEGFVKDEERLQVYLQQLSSNPPGSNWSEAAALAYWINAYNAITVQLIIDHYPLASIKDISDGLPMINSPWDLKFFKIGGIDFDLNTIEHEILRKQFSEPRMHFAINCASFSCPRLRNEAYTAERLELQLKEQTTSFLLNPKKNRLSAETLQLSQIFNWFAGDFTKEQTLIEFLQKQVDLQIQPKAKISFLEYEWSLNNK